MVVIDWSSTAMVEVAERGKPFRRTARLFRDMAQPVGSLMQESNTSDTANTIQLVNSEENLINITIEINGVQ